MLKKDDQIFLGITDKEFKILESIKEIPKNLYTLSKDTRIPRTTLYPIIQKLFKRGLISVERKRNRYTYLSIDPELLIRKLFVTIDNLESLTKKDSKKIEDQKPITKKNFFKSFFKK